MASALAAAAFLALALAGSSCGEGAAVAVAEEAGPAKIVFIAGPPSHASGEHEFNAGAILLARALNEQSGLPVSVEVVHDGWPEDESVFEGARAVIIYSDGNARHPVNGNEALMDALAAEGVGFMFMHFGVEVPPGEQGDYFKQWIGGHYDSGFSANPHWTADVALDESHPVSRGVPGFPVHDEWYYNIRFAEGDGIAHLLTGVPTRERITRYIHWTADAERGLGQRQTMMWAVERPDGGRGIGFTGGHWHRNWAIDEFRRVVLNGIVWVAGVEVPEGGVVSLPVTEEQLNENLDPKDPMVHVDLPSAEVLNQPAAEPIEYRWPGMPNGKGKAKAKAKAKAQP